MTEGAKAAAEKGTANNDGKESKTAVYHFADKASFFKQADAILKKGDTVLVKASHGMEFPEIVEYLQHI